MEIEKVLVLGGLVHTCAHVCKSSLYIFYFFLFRTVSLYVIGCVFLLLREPSYLVRIAHELELLYYVHRAIKAGHNASRSDTKVCRNRTHGLNCDATSVGGSDRSFRVHTEIKVSVCVCVRACVDGRCNNGEREK